MQFLCSRTDRAF